MHRFAVLVLCLLGLARAWAAESTPHTAPDSYRLTIRDQIVVSIYDEPELGATVGIDNGGIVRLPLLDEVNLAGLTVREAEKRLEQLFVEREFLKKPQVTVRIAAYAPREVRVLGPGVRPGGAVQFFPEVAQMDIVEVIQKAGGFTGVAKSKEVMVTRRGPSGAQTFIKNVKAMIEDGAERFFILPGDEIYVGERIIF